MCDLLGAGNMHRGRECIIRALAHIAMIIGVDRAFRADLTAQDLNRPIGDNFIRVHVGLRPGPGLPDHEREMRVELALNHFIRGGDDRISKRGVELAQRHIGLGGGAFHDAERAHQGQRLLFPANLEIA